MGRGGVLLVGLVVLCLNGTLRGEYEVTGVESTSAGVSATLSLSSSSGLGGDPVEALQADFVEFSEQVLRLTITTPENDRYRLPSSILVKSNPTERPSNTDYSYSVSSVGSYFTFNVSFGESDIFQSGEEFYFDDQYLQVQNEMGTLDGRTFYGLGERVGSLALKNKKYYIFNRDQGGAVEGVNLYGSHPFYLQLDDSGVASGVFLLNSNAMHVEVADHSLTYRTIGGALDFFFIVSDSLDGVVQQYLGLVGFPYLHPYWSLGFQQSRYGWRHIQDLESVLQKYEYYGIPLDVMYNDIGYMEDYLDFTFDPVRYPLAQVQDFVSTLHSKNKRYVVIIDPGIANTVPDYPAYERGEQLDLWVKQFDGSGPMIGKVWPGEVVFPDFTHPDSYVYWQEQIEEFYNTTVPIDGIWLDMNEMSSFCFGSCSQYDPPMMVPSPDPYDEPPYNPLLSQMNASTISMSSSFYQGINYDVHNLYGYYEHEHTRFILEDFLQQRSFTLTRSTFVGSGRNGAHWLGDNFAQWSDMQNSIAGVLSMQMFGFSMVGADICGFNLPTPEELCSRWQQLGSLYPFSRNHNAILMPPQLPWSYSHTHLTLTIDALRTRYTLLPYYYTLMFDMSRNGKCCVWRPMAFEYSGDAECRKLDQQFLIGDSILAAPVVTKRAVNVSTYFPADRFYDYYTGEIVGDETKGEYITIDAPIEKLPLFLRGGRVVPGQVPGLNTVESRENDFLFLVSLTADGSASGSFVLDDGLSLETISKGAYDEYECSASFDGSATYSFSCMQSKAGAKESRVLGAVLVNGVPCKPTDVQLTGTSVLYDYDKKSQRLAVTGLRADLSSEWTVTWAC